MESDDATGSPVGIKPSKYTDAIQATSGPLRPRKLISQERLDLFPKVRRLVEINLHRLHGPAGALWPFDLLGHLGADIRIERDLTALGFGQFLFHCLPEQVIDQLAGPV